MSVNTLSIPVGKLFELLKIYSMNHWSKPAMLWGPPGIGKTTIAEALAEWLAEEHKKKTGEDISGRNFHDIRLTTIESVDLRGLPYFDHEKKQSVFYPPAMLPNEAIPGVIFLDEITAADPSLAASAYGLLNERRIGAYKVPDNWFIMAAGNGAEHGAISNEMGTALADRFVHFNVFADVDGWIDFMAQADAHPLVLTHIKKHGDALECCEERVNSDKLLDASPRGWHRVSDFLKTFDPYKTTDRDYLEYIVPGVIGEARAAAFFTDVDDLKNAVDVRKLFEARDKELLELMPKDIGGLYNLIFAVPPLVKDKKTVLRAFDIIHAIKDIDAEDGTPVKEIMTFGMDRFFEQTVLKNEKLANHLIEYKPYQDYRENRKAEGHE